MELVNKSILLISPEPWDHIFVSKHHYAVYLAKKGNRVFFLNPPSKTSFDVKPSDYENLWYIEYNGFPKGLRFYPAFLQRHYISNKFKALEKLCCVDFHVVWSFDNSVFYDFSALPSDVFCISHIVDLNQDFQTKKAAETADLCIGVIEKITNKMSKYNQHTYLVSHGVQLMPTTIEMISLPGTSEVKALYVGNLDMPHIDWELLLTLSERFQQVDFVFVGATKNDNNVAKMKMMSLPNVHFLNSVKANKIFDYLISADILLLCYDDLYKKEYASPHKMMEYLDSGKTTVATWLYDYERLAKEDLLVMAKTTDQYLDNFRRVLNDLSYWNGHALMTQRKNFTSSLTYDKQIERIEKYIQSNARK